MDNIIFKRKRYGILKVKYKGIIYPVVMDYLDYLFINKLKKKFKVDRTGNVYCIHVLDNVKKKILLHHILMAKKCKNFFNNKKVIISHFNGINLDNRYNNLVYGEIKKHKKRTIIIPNIKSDLIPIHVNYMKQDKTHGERFCIKLNKFIWKSSSSKELSIHYKFEETKKFIRLLKINCIRIFNKYFIEYTNRFINSIKTYNTIIHKAKYNNINFNYKFNNLIQPNIINLTDNEKLLLKKFKFNNNLISKINKLA
ncbi:hypothetical protein Hokovirus_2_147 [Hokovirus HKV1]|uniref:Uncharacterized protein n=1 Tax=Hokovirus HKV1 TaxID=1977638 RepID=A0A1V0SFX4_9VIRU|nr:hypothetical protein Hokovirus_2_147 [Hokovirus HKV1]